MPPAEKKKKGTKAAASDTAGVLSLMQKSGFTKAELFVLMDQFKAISKGDDKIDRRKFTQAFSEKEMEELLYGSLTCPEEEKAATVHQIIEKAFLDMDTNQDCKISLEEAKAAIKASPELIKDYFGQNILPVDYLL